MGGARGMEAGLGAGAGVGAEPAAGNAVWTYDPDATLQKDGLPRKRAVRSSPPPVSQGAIEAKFNPHRNGVESIVGAATPMKPRAEEKSYGSHPSSPHSDIEDSPQRTSAPRRTRVSEGKIYENVDGGIDVESSI